jgi:hypothetical protein
LLKFIISYKDLPLIRLCQVGIAIYSMHLSASHSWQLTASGKPLDYWDLTEHPREHQNFKKRVAVAVPVVRSVRFL